MKKWEKPELIDLSMKATEYEMSILFSKITTLERIRKDFQILDY